VAVVLVALGGLLALDQTGVGQFMVSRPLVAGVVAGALLGAPETGLLLGAALELLFLPAFPVGGARVPETGPATLVAVAAGVDGGAGGLAAGLAVGILWALVGSVSVTRLRSLNEKIVPLPERGPVTPARVRGAHLGAIGLDFARGAGLTGLGLWVATVLAPLLREAWPLARDATLGLILVGASLSLGGLLSAFGAVERRRILLLGGLVTGLVLGGAL